MKLNELNDIIISEFDSFAVGNGFTHRRGTTWYCIRNNIYLSIGFEKRSNGYIGSWSVYPLWEYNDVLHISYGSNILFRNGLFSKYRYVISVNLPQEVVIKSIRNIKKIISRRVLPVLSSVTDAVALRKAAVSSPLFLIGDFRKRLIAYCDAYDGNFENAIRLFEECISASGNPGNFTEELKIITLMKEFPDKVGEYFDANIGKMSEREKLNYC